MNRKNRKKFSEQPIGKKIGIVLRNILLGIIALLIIIVVGVSTIPMTEHCNAGKKLGPDVSDATDWMADLDGSLCLNEIAIPGTHDSATEHAQIAFFSVCQDKGIGEQLEMGYRYLDIRLAVDSSQENHLKLMHGFCNCTVNDLPWSSALSLDDVLEDCYGFLEAHPSETIIFCVKQEHGDESVTEFENILNTYVQAHRDSWYLSNSVPTLEEARGKIVLTRRYADDAGLGDEAGLGMRWASQKTEAGVRAEETCETVVYENVVLAVQDRYCYPTEDKWAAFTETIACAWSQVETVRKQAGAENAQGIVINFLTTKGEQTFGHPYQYARVLNQKLFEENLWTDECPGWVIVDFANAEMAKQIYGWNQQ